MGIKTVIYNNQVLLHNTRTKQLGKQLGTKLAALTVAILCASGGAQAEIRYEDKDNRFSLDVRDEPISKVMDSLAERFDFNVDGYPEHWSDDPMNFSATGDLERVLRSLLKDTSHVFEYHTDADTRETRIAALKLLNEGVEGFVANSRSNENSLSNSPTSPGVTAGTEGRRPGRLGDRANNTDRDFATGGNDLGAGNAATAGGTAAAAAPVSGLSASLAARARQSSGTTSASNSASNGGSTAAVNTAPTPGVPNAEMQALTQKALQDVQGLAEALRQAEGN